MVLKYYFSSPISNAMRILFLCFTFLSVTLMAQDKLPFYEIPPAPETTASGNVLARMTQGLGYRYYWATKDLREEDLNYRPSNAAASAYETLEHLYGLSDMIRNTALSQASKRPVEKLPEGYENLRKATLLLLEEASQAFLSQTPAEIESLQLIIARGEKNYTFPIWNLINGPLSDALYHTGQVVSFRRTTGNPIHPGVNVFMGKTKE